jgi:hypothetical protein
MTSHERRVLALMRLHGMTRQEAEKRAKQLERSKPRRVNPGVRKGTAKPHRISQSTRGKPTKRLVRRRKANTKAGCFPNPRKTAAKPRAKTQIVHFDIDVNSHNAKRGSRTKVNPLQSHMSKSRKKANFPYCVETQPTENWNTTACFKEKTSAFEYAKALARQYPKLPIRVMHYAGGLMGV